MKKYLIENTLSTTPSYVPSVSLGSYKEPESSRGTTFFFALELVRIEANVVTPRLRNIWLFLMFEPSLFHISVSGCSHYRRPRVRRVPEARRWWPTAATGTAKTLFAVCQKSGTRQTYSPCVYIGARRKKASRRRHGQLTASAAVRRVPAPWTHGEHPAFAVCPWFWHTAK